MSESERKDEEGSNEASKTELIPTNAPERLSKTIEIFEKVKRESLRESDFAVIQGKKHIKKSGCALLAVVCNLSTQKLEERVEDLSASERIYHFTYRAVAPNGRFADAVGSASTAEKEYTHLQHDARSLAQTRAYNRCILNLVAAGEVSAEEMISDARESTGTPATSESPIPKQPSPSGPTAPEPGSLAAITDEALTADLEKLPWRVNKSKTGGWNIRWDDIPQLIRAKLASKFNELKDSQYLKLGDYSYKRFGSEVEMLARYAAKPNPSVLETTKPSPEPKTQTPSEVHAKSEIPWKVPTTAAQASPDQIEQGIRQTPLGKGIQSFGMVNILGDELALCPERPVPTDNALIDGFLLRKIVEPLVAKHKLAYTLQRSSNGFLEAVLIRGKLDDQQVKELVSGARWAFERALFSEGKKS
jgi:hypothetical protein